MLPQFQSDDKSFTLMQNTWAKELNRLLSQPITQSIILEKVKLAIGVNLVNHLLNRNIVGWIIIRKRAAANIYDTQDANNMPDKMLSLVSDAVVTVDIMVF